MKNFNSSIENKSIKKSKMLLFLLSFNLILQQQSVSMLKEEGYGPISEKDFQEDVEYRDRKEAEEKRKLIFACGACLILVGGSGLGIFTGIHFSSNATNLHNAVNFSQLANNSTLGQTVAPIISTKAPYEIAAEEEKIRAIMSCNFSMPIFDEDKINPDWNNLVKCLEGGCASPLDDGLTWENKYCTVSDLTKKVLSTLATPVCKAPAVFNTCVTKVSEYLKQFTASQICVNHLSCKKDAEKIKVDMIIGENSSPFPFGKVDSAKEQISQEESKPIDNIGEPGLEKEDFTLLNAG